MPLVPALCTQCGAKLEIDSSQEAAVCPYCHTPFVTEKAINNYNTTNVTNIENLHADVVNVSDEQSRDNRVKSGETFIMMNDYVSADKIFTKLSEECPYDYRGWWGLIKVSTQNLKKQDIMYKELCEIKRLYERAITVADEKQKANMEKEYVPYIAGMESKLNAIYSDYKNRINQLTKKYEKETKYIEGGINRLETMLAVKKKRNPAFIVGLIFAIAIFISGAFFDLALGYEPFWLICLCLGVPLGTIGVAVCGILSSIRDTEIRKLYRNIETEKWRFRECTLKYNRELGVLQIELERAGGNG